MMKIWAIKWTGMGDDANVDMSGISLFVNREAAIQQFEDDALIENRDDRLQLVDLLLGDGIVDIDNQVTVVLEEVEVNEK